MLSDDCKIQLTCQLNPQILCPDLVENSIIILIINGKILPYEAFLDCVYLILLECSFVINVIKFWNRNLLYNAYEIFNFCLLGWIDILGLLLSTSVFCILFDNIQKNFRHFYCYMNAMVMFTMTNLCICTWNRIVFRFAIKLDLTNSDWIHWKVVKLSSKFDRDYLRIDVE